MYEVWEQLDGGAIEMTPPIDSGLLGIPVPLMVTLRPDWVCAELGKRNHDALAKLEELHFNQAPVEDPTAAPLGWRLVATATLRELLAHGKVLDESGPFLEADTLHLNNDLRLNCTELFRAFETSDAKFVVWQDQIVGLLTTSDLNKRHVRALLFQKFFALEAALARMVGEAYGHYAEWLSFLGEDAKAHVLGWTQVARMNDRDIDPIETVMLRHLVEIVCGSKELQGRLGIKPAKKARSALMRLANLRNTVMHPVRPLVLDSADVTAIKENLIQLDALLTEEEMLA
jgi:hypothetical protein